MTTKKKTLLEGGAGGHMFHPFNLPSVHTGQDLVDFFESAIDFIRTQPEKVTPSKSASLKIDGVNTSFKLIKGDSGLEFALDRGSTKSIDIEGITIDRLDERFPQPGHGMRGIGKILLSILNKSISKLKPELAALGVLDKKGRPDSTKFFNAEFVWKKTNVVEYEVDFIAIHALNQFYEKTNSRTGNYRPGATRPLVTDPMTGDAKPAAGVGYELEYSEEAMESLRTKLEKEFSDIGFKVFTVVPVRVKDNVEVIFSEILNQPLTIQVEEGGSITKTLSEWLNDEVTVNPRNQHVKLSDGKSITALSKLVYGEILGGTPVSRLLTNPEQDTPIAISGALFYYTTQVLGAAVMKSLTSPLGDLVTTDMTHEGVVLRSEERFGVQMVKITGDFITAGTTSTFRDKPEEQVEPAGDEETDFDNKPFRVALVPGAFKPPHRGHLRMVEQFANIGQIDKVIILISNPLKRSRTLPSGKVITSEHAKLIWESYIAGSSIGKAEVLISNSASPMTAVYDYIGNPTDDNDPLVAQTNSEVFLGCGDKGSDVGRFKESGKYTREDVKVKIVACPLEEKHSSSYMSILQSSEEISSEMPSMNDSSKDPADFHASDMRYLAEKAITNVTARELFSDFTPHGDALAVMGILGLNPVDTPEDEDVYTEVVFNCIDELLVEDFQSKMKSSLTGEMAWFLDQGRKDLTKYGGGFHLDRPKGKSNAFLAEEDIEEDLEEGLIGIIDNAGQVWDDQDKELEETSSMAGGAVAGAASRDGGPWAGFTDEDNEEEKKRTQQNRN